MKMKLGVQLYSLRKEIAADGLDTVLGVIRDAGFQYVEFAGYYGLSPEELNAKLAQFGLQGMSAHIGLGDIEKSLPYIRTLSLPAVYIPFLKVEQLTDSEVCTQAASVLGMLQKEGVRTGYHNHAHEYPEGKDYVEAFMDAVPGMCAQLDVFWAAFAGLYAPDLVKKYGKRLSCVHIKELDSRTTTDAAEYPNPVPGEGKTDMAAVIRTAVGMGVSDFVLEVEGFPMPYPAYLKSAFAAIADMYKNA